MKYTPAIAVAVGTVVLALLPMLVFAQAAVGLQPVEELAGTADGSLNVLVAVRSVVNVLLTVLGLIAVIFIVIGGIRYVVSQGEEDQAAQAKRTILYAVIGLIVVGLSAVLVNFVIFAIQA